MRVVPIVHPRKVIDPGSTEVRQRANREFRPAARDEKCRTERFCARCALEVSKPRGFPNRKAPGRRVKPAKWVPVARRTNGLDQQRSKCSSNPCGTCRYGGA